MATTFDTTSPEALRKAIIARLGIDPKKLTAFGGSPEFDAKVTDLYRGTTSKLSGLDTSEQALFIEQEIEKFLGIEDKRVKGELR